MAMLRGLIAAGVRNPVYANMLAICILAGGLYAAGTLVTETYPEFSLDRILIETPYPGASAEEVEQGVCIKIEEALQGVAGVYRIWSRSSENAGLVVAQLTADVDDPRRLMLDIKDRIDQITTFPPDVEQPVVRESVIRGQVVNIAVYGDIRERALRELAVEVRDELRALREVSQVTLTGVRDSEISIEVAPAALQRYGLSLPEVSAAVARSCVDLPAGTLRTQNEVLTLKTVGQRYTAQEFEDIVVIARQDGTLIKLAQIATVTDGFAEELEAGRFEGQPAAVVEVYKTATESTSDVALAVREYVAEKQPTLPAGVSLDVWADTSRDVDARIAMLRDNGLLGIVLVVVVLSLFLDGRVSLYVALGIPISFAGGLIVMHFTGQTLNMITMFGLIMVTGIIVDDAIVIADGFRARIAAGDAPALAAIEGTAEVGLPVLASSLTTVLAFAPLLFVVGVMGKFIGVLPVVVIATVAFSAIEAFGVLPAHLQHCLHRRGASWAWLRPLTQARNAIDRGTQRFIEGVYHPLLRRALAARGLTLACAAACLLLTVGWIAGGRISFILLPETDANMLRARVRFAPGVIASRAAEAVAQLEAGAEKLNAAAQTPLVRKTSSLIGAWSGIIRERGTHLCEVVVELQPAEDRRIDSDAILADWEHATGIVDDTLAVVYERVDAGPTEKPLEVRLLGDDLPPLARASDELAAHLAAFDGVSGIEHDLRPGKREVRVRLSPLARTLGVTVDDLARQLRTGFYGGEAVRVQRGREEVRVQVRYPQESRQHIADLENVRIRGSSGEEVPLLELADYTVERGYAQISRQDGKRRVRVTADVDERRANAERILAEVEQDFLPELTARYPGVVYRLEGQHAQIVESLRSLFAGFALALVAIYAVLASMLRSYVQPLIIMAAIPLGGIGAIVGHVLTGCDLSLMSIFGIVALAGVVVNDALVLLDRVNGNVRAGHSILDAVTEAGAVRFRAVLLTTVTTVAGLAPLLLERSVQARTIVPMAVSLTFGLALATVLTLLVVPALYVAVSDARRLAHWLRRGGAYPSAEELERQAWTA